MGMSSFYDLLNAMTLAMGAVMLFLIFLRRLNSADILFVFGIFFAFTFFAFWLGSLTSANIALLLMALYFVFHPRNNYVALNSNSQYINFISILGLILIFITVLLLAGKVGWQSVASSSLKYWLIYALVFVFSIQQKEQSKVKIGLILFVVGLIWQFKFAIFMAGILVVFHFLSTRSSKIRLLYVLGLSVSIGAAILLFPDYLNDFIDRSVLRPDYKYDTNFFGISDGARLKIWISYLEGSVWLGNGEFNLPDLLPTHNFFIYVAHEGGFIPMIIFGTIFLYLVIRISFYFSYTMAILIFVSFNISSMAEYASTWVICLIVLPSYFGSKWSRRRSRRSPETNVLGNSGMQYVG